MKKRELGRQGEELAVSYLKKKGYRILDQNYYTRYGELDIVCRKANQLVFVEVKTRRNTSYGSPEEAITPRKIQHLKRAAAVYLESVNPSFHEVRFDVIAIILEEGQEKINHIEYAF